MWGTFISSPVIFSNQQNYPEKAAILCYSNENFYWAELAKKTASHFIQQSWVLLLKLENLIWNHTGIYKNDNC